MFDRTIIIIFYWNLSGISHLSETSRLNPPFSNVSIDDPRLSTKNRPSFLVRNNVDSARWGKRGGSHIFCNQNRCAEPHWFLRCLEFEELDKLYISMSGEGILLGRRGYTNWSSDRSRHSPPFHFQSAPQIRLSKMRSLFRSMLWVISSLRANRMTAHWLRRRALPSATIISLFGQLAWYHYDNWDGRVWARAWSVGLSYFLI